jgi:hypothetical protein
MISIRLGDLAINATQHQSLDKNDPMPWHYLIQVTDLPSARTEIIHCDSEMDQIKMIAAWLLIDENVSVGPMMSAYMDRVREKFPAWSQP